MPWCHWPWSPLSASSDAGAGGGARRQDLCKAEEADCSLHLLLRSLLLHGSARPCTELWHPRPLHLYMDVLCSKVRVYPGRLA